jgi:phosphatidylglycerophosphatase A
MNRIARLLATGLYTGLSPVAPGTAGSLLGLAILWGLDVRFGLSGRRAALAAGTGLLFFIGVWAATRVEAEEIGRGGKKDPGLVNLDEVVGMGVSTLFWPAQAGRIWLVAAFLLFRLFDVMKPPPANRIQDLPRGWGIMADDAVAGAYANIVLRILVRLLG